MKSKEIFLSGLILMGGVAAFAKQAPLEEIADKSCSQTECSNRSKPLEGRMSKPTDEAQSTPQATEKRVVWTALPVSSGDNDERPRIGSEQGWVRVGSVPSMRRGYGNIAQKDDHRSGSIKGGRSASRIIKMRSKKSGKKDDKKGILEVVSFEQNSPNEAADQDGPEIDAAYLDELKKKLKELQEISKR